MQCPLCLNNTKTVIANHLRAGGKRNVYYCQQCEFGMLERKNVKSDLKAFYRDDYRKEHGATMNKGSSPKKLFEDYADFQEERIRVLKKIASKKSIWLDIGCSAGMFLFHAKKYVDQVVGIDYDSKSAQFAAKKCKCPVFDTDIEETSLPEQSFDVISAFQTLEHVEDPVEFIGKIKKYLKKNGKIYIEVPNLHDALVYAYNLPGHHKNFYFHSAHPWYFTEKSLKILMKKVGFSGRVFFTQDYNILNHMHWISVDRPQANAFSGLSLPQLPLRNTFDKSKAKKLNRFIKETNETYKNLLAELKITSNISFIGKKNER